MSAVRAPAAPTPLPTLRAAYAQFGSDAWAVARALCPDGVQAEEIVVAAFVAASRDQYDRVQTRRAVLTNIVARCEQRWRHESPGRRNEPWASLPGDRRVALALASLGHCSLDDIAAIVDADRGAVARALTDALRSAAS